MTAKTNCRRFTNLDPAKLRGGYYTPRHLAQWLADWAIRSPEDTVLEPSCGDGVFLEAAAIRLSRLGGEAETIKHAICGVEVNDTESSRARARLGPALVNGSVVNRDFFEWWGDSADRRFSAILGNPPFIRYQSFPEPYRTRAMDIMAYLGLKPNRLTNIWVPFVVASVDRLATGGRLALVLPAELLQVSYAAQLRSYLTGRFHRLDIVTCNELFFENAEQEVVLLLADGAITSPTLDIQSKVAITEAQSVSEIVGKTPEEVLVGAEVKSVQHDSEKWLKYFLKAAEIDLLRELRESHVAADLSTHARVDVGVVTGNNEFFVVDRSRQIEFGLAPFTSPLISRSVQLKGAVLTHDDWIELSKKGERVHLLNVKGRGEGPLANTLASYIAHGELAAVHKGYKCSIRNPWYTVPSVWQPDGFLFRQIYDFPRMVFNDTAATSTDTIHRLKCATDPERTITNIYTYLTAASAEIEGRSYGGGVLELEPTEAERLLLPAVLTDALPIDECDRLIRAGRIEDLLEENSRMILGAMGLSTSEQLALKNIWIKMRDRRQARRRSPRRLEQGVPML